MVKLTYKMVAVLDKRKKHLLDKCKMSMHLMTIIDVTSFSVFHTEVNSEYGSQ